MPNNDSHAPGPFTWIELATTDQKAAQAFYTSLFGWTANEMPMGPGEVYVIFQLYARDAAAAYNMNAQMREQKVPPHWGLYVATESADETAATAAENGGKLLAAPFDVMDFGRMAVIQDPTGATINIWQAKTHAGTKIVHEPGTICWADLNTPDAEKASAFYK